MPIDATKPTDGVDAAKSDLRSNLQAAADGIATLDSPYSGTAITMNAASYGDHGLVRLRCTSNSSVAVTLANNVPAGRALEVVQYGNGVVTVSAAAGATLVKPSSASFSTAAQYDAMVFEVDTNSGANAQWRLVFRS